MKSLAYPLSLVQMDLDDYTTHRKQKYLQYIIMGYRELKLKGQTNVSTAYLKMNSVLNSPLPPDYVDWIKVGVNYGGKLLTLSVNQDLMMENRYDECGDEFSSALSNLEQCNSLQSIYEVYGGVYTWIDHYRAGNYVGELYGAGGGNNPAGYFKVDKQMNLIQFTPEVPRTEIVLEYVSDASTVNISTIIPTELAEVLRQYTHWQLEEFSNKSNESKVYRAFGRYNRAYQDNKDRMSLVTVEQYLDACWSTYQSSPKR